MITTVANMIRKSHNINIRKIKNTPHRYLVLELCDSDFKKLFKLPEFLSESHIITLLFNTLCGLKYVHSAGIYHRDLKPANCLVNRDCAVKICDFGLSRPVTAREDTSANFFSPDEDEDSNSSNASTRQPKRSLTGHVVTRWYRAPELILLQENYTEQIDMWSLGCIFAELLGMIKDNFRNPKDRCPLFQGNDITVCLLLFGLAYVLLMQDFCFMLIVRCHRSSQCT